MSNRNDPIWLSVLGIIIMLTVGVGCGVARYKECRTAHPWWYCIGGK